MYEWSSIIKFAETNDFSGDGYNVEVSPSEMLSRNQLRSLWTAYCILYGLEPDTYGYDARLGALWDAVIENRVVKGSNDKFDDFTCFDLWMGEFLC